MKFAIFDLDGTLLDTLADLAASTNHALAQCNLPARSIEEIRQFVGNGVGKLIERAVPAGSTQEQVSKCLSIFRQHYAAHSLDRTRPYPGVLPMLANLRRRGVGLAIVSNKPQPAVDKLRQEFFSAYIDIAIGERPQMPRKPAPNMLLEAMRLLSTDASPENTIYVGDSDVDLLTARAAQLRCISVSWGFRSRRFLLAHGAATIVEHPEEIEWIKELKC